jgi:hypothetical protein
VALQAGHGNPGGVGHDFGRSEQGVTNRNVRFLERERGGGVVGRPCWEGCYQPW